MTAQDEVRLVQALGPPPSEPAQVFELARKWDSCFALWGAGPIVERRALPVPRRMIALMRAANRHPPTASAGELGAASTDPRERRAASASPVTLLFTDIQGGAALWDRGEARMCFPDR